VKNIIYKIDVKQIRGNNFWYILKRNNKEIARSGQRQTVVDIIANYLKIKMSEQNTIEIK